MNPLNEANFKIADYLTRLHILGIGLEDHYEDEWLYIGSYPLEVNNTNFYQHQVFEIHLFRWVEKHECLKLIKFTFQIQNGIIQYLKSDLLDENDNQFGLDLSESKELTDDVLPLFKQSLREIKIDSML